ncbi:MAG: hypothetical protein KGJ98_06740 [Chloroflexota bacterium]|nr:hypothetical protein [Chloroflexota bacterium]
MKLPKNARIVAGGAALAVAFLAGIALAPSVVAPAAAHLLGGTTRATTDNAGPGPHGTGLFTVAAQYIGISVDQLRTEMGTTQSMADVAVAHGKTRDGLVQALTTAAQQDLSQRITSLVDHKGAPQPGKGPGGRPGMGRFFGGNELNVASTYLGISTTDLRTKLHSGQSLAQIATAAGKSTDGLIQAIVQDETTKIDQAVSSGKLTSAQATQIKADLTQRVTDMVNNTRPMGPGFGHRPWGPPPAASPAASQ